MNKCKRFLALLLVLCMMLSVVPFSALAAETTDESDEQVELQTGDPGSGTERPGTIPDADPPALEEPVEDPVEEAPSEDTPSEDTPSEEAPAEENLDDETSTDEEVTDDENIDIMQTSVSEVEARDTSADGFYKIVHLDCGRKYFSKDWIIALINEMAADGYNQLQLAFGNDGLRFLLDDMSFTANGTTYSHSSVVSAVESGNQSQNTSGDKSWLTQREMDEIIAAAKAKNIEIVPLLNLPGHANAILDIVNDAYNVSGSNNTLDMSNDAAVEFAMAIFQKYVDYFAGKGCKFFNFGADEYANDISGGSFSFSRLNSTGYQSFVSFINKLAGYIKEKGMTPRAFNDGLYYGSYSSVSIDTSIQCCYWSSGWSGYNVASASTIAKKGHQMINTNGDFYYVLGKSDQFDSGYSYASNFSNTVFTGSTISNPAGSMFCIWCDYPNAESETDIAKNVRLTLRAMAKRMNDESIDYLDDYVVSGGFNADGSINTDSSGGGSGSETPTIQKDGENVSTFSVKMGGTATLTLSDSEATATWTSSDENVATVTALTRSVEANSVTVTPVGEGTATITAELSDGTKLTTDVTVTAAGTTDEPEYNVEITLDVGEEKQEKQENVNNKENVDRSNLNTGIATVEVTGTDAMESTTTYTEASVTCNNLISSNSNNWTAVSGYYYKANDGSYYPLYAMRSRQWSWDVFAYTYTYTWGYSTTSTITQIGTQSTTDTSDAPNITVYTKEDVEAVDASTTITFTGVYPGTTYVTVGDTTYKIIVNYKTKTINAVIDQSTTEKVSGEADTSMLDTSIATVSISDGIMTVTGKSEGETKVTVGDTIYTIKVTKEDLSQVIGLTVEFWITNQQVTANGVTGMTINASDSGVYSQSGALFSSLVPATGAQGGNTMDFWKGTRLASDNKQTNASGVDKTTSGTDFTYIRYWNGFWAYSSDGNTWTNVESGDQIVAYYLQRTDVTDEITTQVVDWGPKKANWSDLNYLGTKYVLLDYTVKYESGEETPSSFPTDKSLSFHCDTQTTKDGHYYRTLGMIRGVENANYEVYMITVTPTSDSPSNNLSSTAAGNTSYTYAGTEVVAWAATQDDLDNSGLDTYTSISGNFTYSIGGEPIVSGLEIYRQHGMKVTFYVRAKVTEDSLSVHYIDQTTNSEFYNYNIAVKSGTLFDENIGLDDPWKGNLANGSVTNLQDKTQTVSADLSTMPAIGVQYRYSDYTCVRVERSEDGKNVYLYYTFDNTHSFVVDFGLPVEISVDQISANIDTLAGASIAGVKYGSAEINSKGNLLYTPTKMLGGVESMTLTITESDSTASHQIYIYPATTVYYEEGFATYSGSWTDTGSKGSAKQEAQVAGSSQDEYGYDAAYANGIGASNGTRAISTTKGDTCSFSFTGTGFEVYANCGTETGNMTTVVITKDNKPVKVYMVDTVAANGETDATTGQNDTFYSLPVISEQNLAFDTYNVTITHTVDNKAINIDGFRIYGTLAMDNAVYVSDLEDNPTFIELRDQVLASMNAIAADSAQYADQIAKNTLSQVYATAGTLNGVVITEKPGTYTDENLTDLLDNGPKNEIFLRPGQSLTFTITTKREVQIGLKAPNAAASYTIMDGETTVKSETISSSTDMFYKIVSKAGSEAPHTITITNTNTNTESDTNTGILSVTKLKVCDDPNASLSSLTEEALIPAMLSHGYEKKPEGTDPVEPTDPVDPVNPTDPVEPTEPEQPEVVCKDATLTVSLVDYTGKQISSVDLTANGAEGETKVFTAGEVLAAAKANVPNGYVLVDESKVTGAEVAYGQSGKVTVQIGKTATLKVVYVNLRGKNVGTATITKVQTSGGNLHISASDIRDNAPAGRRAVWLTNVRVPYGSEMTIVVPTF